MITIEKVIENLKELQLIPYNEIQNEIIIAFAGYTEKGITEVIVSELETGKKYEAYINSENSTLVIIRTETSVESPSEIDLMNVIDVYIEG